MELRVLSTEEAEFMSYVRRDGRITIPTEVRAALDIEMGNLVKCRVQKIRLAGSMRKKESG